MPTRDKPMKILLFGINNIDRKGISEALGKKFRIPYFDVEEEIIKKYKSLEKFIAIGEIEERDAKREEIIDEILFEEENCVIAVSPISTRGCFEKYVNDKSILAIDLYDSIEHLYENVAIDDEDDNNNMLDLMEFKERYYNYHLHAIRADIEEFEKTYEIIKNKYNVDGKSPNECAQEIIEKYKII